MPTGFHRLLRRVTELELGERLLGYVPAEHRHTLAEVARSLREVGRLPRPELIRRRPVEDGQIVRGAAVVLGAIDDGGALYGVNLVRGEVAGVLRGVNIVVGGVRGGDVRGVNVLLGDVHEGRVRAVNAIIGDVHGGEVSCNLLLGDVYAGRVEVEVFIGQDHGGAVEARERVHLHEHAE
ncbi:hypothetical protein [Haliangium sp.]|uniref:hypothetical protein n=1 Tax=Haliangium sp. TaxID=2663208 RepID=UPI003D0B9BB0